MGQARPSVSVDVFIKQFTYFLYQQSAQCLEALSLWVGQVRPSVSVDLFMNQFTHFLYQQSVQCLEAHSPWLGQVRLSVSVEVFMKSSHIFLSTVNSVPMSTLPVGGEGQTLGNC